MREFLFFPLLPCPTTGQVSPFPLPCLKESLPVLSSALGPQGTGVCTEQLKRLREEIKNHYKNAVKNVLADSAQWQLSK